MKSMNKQKKIYTYDKAKQQLLQIRWINSLGEQMNAILYKNVGYSSNRMIEVLGKYSFCNIPVKNYDWLW